VPVHPDATVDEVMRRRPETIRVFLRHRMRCVGCPLGRFHAIGYACEAHGVSRERFVADLDAAVAEAGEGPPPRAPSPRRP
jgi:hybrid cluster-associated redox disulfide protein